MILILTPNSINPLHPRLEYTEKFLQKNGYEVKKFNLQSNNKYLNRINWITLKFFNISAILKSIPILIKYKKETELVWVQDLQYLPIVIFAKILKKKVIYETMDNNVEYVFYIISTKFKILKKLNFIKKIMVFIEKKIAKVFCDEIVVNSKALVNYFNGIESNLIYYTSPFEGKFRNELTPKKTALLYLGGFWETKGANEIIKLVEKYQKKLFIFGTITEKKIKEKVDKLNKKNLVRFMERLSSNDLEKELKSLSNSYNLIGLSLIKSVHYSYETQEANKDIDYLSLGIPIIGNHRKPTEEKINAGCGVFIEDENNIERLFNEFEFYKKLSNQCINYYNKHYSQKKFEESLIKVVKKLL